MPRKRMIDPDIWQDDHFGMLSDKAKILFISVISNADDDGRINAHPANLRALTFRYDTGISISKVEELTQEIASNLKNFLVYSVNGCKYIQLKKWEEYQTQRDDRRKPSRMPIPNIDDGQMSAKCQSDDGQMSAQVKLSKVKLSKVKLREDKIPPSLEEVTSYFKELSVSPLEANKFCDYFSSNGWKVGGRTQMKDWRAAARNWARRVPAEQRKPVYKPEPAPVPPVIDKEQLKKVRELVAGITKKI